MKPKSPQSIQLYNIMLRLGYPEEFADIVTKNLNTDFTATRMMGYLYRYSNPRLEDVADEMLAILDDRNRIMEKKELEEINKKIAQFNDTMKKLRLERNLCKRIQEDIPRVTAAWEKAQAGLVQKQQRQQERRKQRQHRKPGQRFHRHSPRYRSIIVNPLTAISCAISIKYMAAADNCSTNSSISTFAKSWMHPASEPSDTGCISADASL